MLKNKDVVHETIELRDSIKNEKLQKLMKKSLRRAMEKQNDYNNSVYSN